VATALTFIAPSMNRKEFFLAAFVGSALTLIIVLLVLSVLDVRSELAHSAKTIEADSQDTTKKDGKG